MCGTRGSNPPMPYYYHLFIHSSLIIILFIKFYLSNFIFQILFIYLFIYLSNLIYLCIYLFIHSWCFDTYPTELYSFVEGLWNEPLHEETNNRGLVLV